MNESDDDDASFDDAPAVAEFFPLIQRVVVVGLHGRSSYDLNLKTTEEFDRVALFYGDNGSGKTTILRLIWDLLSPAPNRGHRSRLKEVVFETFEVHLEGEVTVAAKRKIAVFGPYEIEARRRGELISKSSWGERTRFEEYFNDWPLDTFEKRLGGLDPEVRADGSLVFERKRYLQLLESFGAAPYYLADDRSTSSDEISKSSDAQARRLGTTRDEGPDRAGEAQNKLAMELESALSRVNAKLRRLALGANVSGSANANSVYIEVLRRFGASALNPEHPASDRDRLKARIRLLGVRSKQFEVLGLTPKFASSEFSEEIGKVSREHLGLMSSIIEPYLESLSARLDALQESQTIIQTLLDEANQFLTDKRLDYQAPRGLRIMLVEGEALRPQQLSSGECHLLLLLCNAILARGNARIFLIDEPELSLNVKWQRRIVKSLLACTEGSGLQFILATHSIELLSNFRSRVVKLESESVE